LRVNVYLRNVHPKQIIHLPLAPGWHRVLRPAVTACVPERILHLPAVRQLLIGQLIEIVDGAAWDPDIRQRRASRIDMARAIAAAEQREFDRLRQHRRQETTASARSWTRWDADLEARLLRTDYAGLAALATELGIARRSLLMRRAALRRSGLRRPHERKRRADEWTPELIDQLRQGCAAGLTWQAIAGELGRTVGACYGQAKRLGLRRVIRAPGKPLD
jgi:hypothetical protein